MCLLAEYLRESLKLAWSSIKIVIIKEIICLYSAFKKNEILPFATTWMELEGIMLSGISQSEKDRDHMIFLMCGI